MKTRKVDHKWPAFKGSYIYVLLLNAFPIKEENTHSEEGSYNTYLLFLTPEALGIIVLLSRLIKRRKHKT